jgi:hypothetical protein
MGRKLSKRDRVKKAIKSGGQKLAKFTKSRGQKLAKFTKSRGQKLAEFTKSRFVRKFIPLLGLIALITPGKAMAFSLPEVLGLDGPNSKNATFIAAEFVGIREVTRQGVSAIPDPGTRTAVSSIGSLTALVGGISCGVGSAICSGMGWEQKAMVCLHGVGICSGIASGLHDADPANPVTVPGKLASEVVDKMVI